MDKKKKCSTLILKVNMILHLEEEQCMIKVYLMGILNYSKAHIIYGYKNKIDYAKLKKNE